MRWLDERFRKENVVEVHEGLVGWGVALSLIAFILPRARRKKDYSIQSLASQNFLRIKAKGKECRIRKKISSAQFYIID